MLLLSALNNIPASRVIPSFASSRWAHRPLHPAHRSPLLPQRALTSAPAHPDCTPHRPPPPPLLVPHPPPPQGSHPPLNATPPHAHPPHEPQRSPRRLQSS